MVVLEMGKHTVILLSNHAVVNAFHVHGDVNHLGIVGVETINLIHSS